MNAILFHCLKIFTIGIALIQIYCSQKPPTEKRDVPVLNTANLPYMERRDADSVTIYWEPPSTTSDSLYYQLYYSTYPNGSQTLLKDRIPASKEPSVVVYRKDISSKDSIFQFSVRSVLSSSEQSDFHYSIDATATPPGGWFLFWKGK
ncbi:MAG: hypothetical protein JW795_05700 [Chitinivibrionales bacterium]|nr:hypothetical protein [Chitinivibrionales bacterium]